MLHWKASAWPESAGAQVRYRSSLRFACQAGHLTVFQRSAAYVLPHMDRTYTPEERELFASGSNAFWADRNAYGLKSRSSGSYCFGVSAKR
jgi:cation diffusion facilitator CzcD-associated flavoprotein CzcO